MRAARRYVLGGLLLLAATANMAVGAHVAAYFRSPPASNPTFYAEAQAYASEECSHLAPQPTAFDTCWRATLADFYALGGNT